MAQSGLTLEPPVLAILHSISYQTKEPMEGRHSSSFHPFERQTWVWINKPESV